MTEPNIDYYHNNDYQTGHQNGILDATNGFPYEDMTVKGYSYQTGYKEGWKWAKTELLNVDKTEVTLTGKSGLVGFFKSDRGDLSTRAKDIARGQDRPEAGGSPAQPEVPEVVDKPVEEG